MIRKYLTVFGLLALAITSCTKDDVLDTNDDLQNDLNTTDVTVKLTTKIESIAPLTRADISVDGKGSFVDNDVISLLYNQEQKNLTLVSGEWTPALPWNEIGSQASFSAFFPKVQLDYSNVFAHTVLTDQDKDNQFEKSDLLFADAVHANKGEQVNLNFRHLMSCITVVLKGNAYTHEEFESAKVQIKAYNKIDVMRNGTLGKLYDYKHGVDLMSEITFHHKGEGVFQAAVCPQQIQGFDYRGWWLMITVGGKEYKVADPPEKLKDGTPFRNLVSGKNVKFTYSFYENDPEFSNKVSWVYGLKNMPDPSSDDWEVFHKQDSYIRKHLPWNASYGWYDCSKKSTIDPSYDDMNMCWAATSSNMIHWWFDQNKAYVDEYYRLNPSKKGTIPSQYINHHDSEVFQVFKTNFIDEGGFPDLGSDWYFLGKYNAPANAAHLINPKSGGYFKDVFGQNTTMTQRVGIVTMDDLTAALKNAFRNKQAIGFAVIMKGFGSAHAMTIWGAKFDKKGDVCAIYYTDNNDGNLGQIPVGLIAARVGEYEGNEYPEFRGKACLENSQGKTAIYIQNLYLLNLKQDEWKQYLNKTKNF